jgi:putative hydrolase of the HAD superfamily|tara:strand:- start:268 stop:933 length:666 start_codon:yes stop_codon:yes gene_type:complete
MVKIKAIIFDMDNTLHDAEHLSELSIPEVVQEMIDRGVKILLEEGIEKFRELLKNDPRNKFDKLAEMYSLENNGEIMEAVKFVYKHPRLDNMKILPGTLPALKELKGKFRLVLLSQGQPDSQNKRIDVLGIRDFFEFILTPMTGEKARAFDEALGRLNLHPEEIFVVGDRTDGEIKIANDLGMKTVRFRFGKYGKLEARDDSEKADFEIKDLRELLDIVNE